MEFKLIDFQNKSNTKITQNVAFEFLILAFSTNFWPIKTQTDMSGNTVWPQALGFQTLAKTGLFGIFNWNVNVARFARNVDLEDFLNKIILYCFR